jgi:predicted amidophosphoribosyltransferase
MNCPHCDKNLSPSAHSCPECGHVITGPYRAIHHRPTWLGVYHRRSCNSRHSPSCVIIGL